MENQSPFTAEPFATKRSDGKVEVCLTTYKSWLPMFYLLPKEYVQKRSVYLTLPRCPYAIWNTNQYDELVNSDAFLEMIWDSYAWAIWNCFLVPDKKRKAKMDADQYQLLLRQFPALAFGVYHHESYPKKVGRRSDSHIFPPALFASGHGIFVVYDGSI